MSPDEFFQVRHAELEEGVLRLLGEETGQTATQLRTKLRAGMREMDRVLQSMRVRGLIQSRQRRWECAA